MNRDPIPVSLNVSELDVLPEATSLSALETSSESCWMQMLPGFSGPASAVSSVAMGEAGGPRIPDDWSKDPVVTMRPLTLVKIVGAFYFPHFGVVIDLHGRAFRTTMNQAGYYTPDLLKLFGMQKSGDDTVFVPSPGIRTLSSAFVTMPWGALHNYGHFVADCLPAVMTFRQTRTWADTPFVFPLLQPWHREHLALLGIEQREVRHAHFYVEQAFFTSCMETHLESPTESYQWLSEAARSAVLAESGQHGNAVRRMIYLSRRGSGKRTLIDEDKLEEALRIRGFDIIRPETLSVKDQVLLYATASVVVGPAGSGFANVLFCSPGAVVVEIKPEGLRSWWVRNMCLQIDCRWSPYFCENDPETRPGMVDGEERAEVGIAFRIDQEDFLGHVDRAIDWSRSHGAGRN